jgi:hypothetical protein
MGRRREGVGEGKSGVVGTRKRRRGKRKEEERERKQIGA